MEIPQNSHELIVRWHKRTKEIQHSQYQTGKKLLNRNRNIGLAILVINVIVGSAIFLSIKTDLGDIGKLIAGILTLAAALLAALQTFLKFGEQAEKHQSAGFNAGALRRKTEQILSKGPNYNITNEEIEMIRKEFDTLSKNSPIVPDNIWVETEKKLIEAQ